MAKATQKYSDFVQEIIDGKHDDELEQIQSVAAWRMKNLWRKGMPVRLKGTKNADLEGQVGVILRVNQKTVGVGVGKATTDQWGTTYDGGEYNVPPRMLEAIRR